MSIADPWLCPARSYQAEYSCRAACSCQCLDVEICHDVIRVVSCGKLAVNALNDVSLFLIERQILRDQERSGLLQENECGVCRDWLREESRSLSKSRSNAAVHGRAVFIEAVRANQPLKLCPHRLISA